MRKSNSLSWRMILALALGQTNYHSLCNTMYQDDQRRRTPMCQWFYSIGCNSTMYSTVYRYRVLKWDWFMCKTWNLLCRYCVHPTVPKLNLNALGTWRLRFHVAYRHYIKKSRDRIQVWGQDPFYFWSQRSRSVALPPWSNSSLFTYFVLTFPCSRRLPFPPVLVEQ